MPDPILPPYKAKYKKLPGWAEPPIPTDDPLTRSITQAKFRVPGDVSMTSTSPVSATDPVKGSPLTTQQFLQKPGVRAAAEIVKTNPLYKDANRQLKRERLRGAFERVKGRVTLGANQLAPFASNIANTFTKPPKPPAPNLDAPVALQRVNMDKDRNDIRTTYRGINQSATRTLDENTAMAVRGNNVAGEIGALSKANEVERNTNREIGNQEVGINASIAGRNNAKLDQYGNNLVEMKVANQREKSENLSSAADKYVRIGNEKAKANLEEKKFGIIASMYSQDGVAGRTFKTLADVTSDPVGLSFYSANKDKMSESEIIEKLNEPYKKRQTQMRKDLGYRNGGFITTFKPIK